MTRQRMVKPDFFLSESLGDCEISARLAFIGIWVMADDCGNMKLQVKKMRTQIFPYDCMTDEKFSDLLSQLERNGCIKVYTVNDETYVNVPNFNVYQTIKKPSKTSIPAPSEKVQRAKRTCFFKVSSGELVDHQLPTSDPKERKKEEKDSNESFSKEENQPNADGANEDAADEAWKMPSLAEFLEMIE